MCLELIWSRTYQTIQRPDASNPRAVSEKRDTLEAFIENRSLANMYLELFHFGQSIGLLLALLFQMLFGVLERLN
jgi:hypothetical protein